MHKIFSAALIFGALGAGPLSAQTGVPPTTLPSTLPTAPHPAAMPSVAAVTPPAVASSGANNTTAAPVAGANSFTMGQAQKRIEGQGYTQVTALAKDAQSVWRGRAMKDGKAVDVALDYQGNITSN